MAMTAGMAIMLLCELGCVDDLILIRGRTESAGSLMYDHKVETRKASTVKITYYHTAKHTKKQGTLYSMVQDRIKAL